MSKRNPDEIAADQPGGHPTGNESTAKKSAPAASAAQAAAPAAEEAMAQMQQVASEYYEKLADLSADFAEQARGYLTEGRAYAREHPAGTLAGGFALGVLVGALLGRN